MTEIDKVSKQLENLTEEIVEVRITTTRIETDLKNNVLHRINKLEEREDAKNKLLFGVLTPLVVKFLSDIIKLVG